MKSMNRFQLYTCTLIQQSAHLHPPGIVHGQETAQGHVPDAHLQFKPHKQLPCILQISNTCKKEHRDRCQLHTCIFRSMLATLSLSGACFFFSQCCTLEHQIFLVDLFV